MAPLEAMMSTAELLGASAQQAAAASVIQGCYRQRPGHGSKCPAPGEGSFNLRKAASVKSSPIEGMILDKRSSNAATGSIIQGRYRQRPGDGSQRPAVAPSQGFPFRKGVSSPEHRPPRSAHGAHDAHAALAAAGSNAAHAALQDSEAACLIQRFVRRRKSERLHGRWLQIIELRKQFIDAEVVNPGELYDDDMLLAREALKSEPKLKAAIATAWDACSQGSVLLSKEGYFTMMRKLYLCLTLDDGAQPDSP